LLLDRLEPGGWCRSLPLWVYQQRARSPLLTARSLASTIPVAWTVVAICAAAVSMPALEPAATVSPLRAAAPEAATTRLGMM
jgi:hypothetical protein